MKPICHRCIKVIGKWFQSRRVQGAAAGSGSLAFPLLLDHRHVMSRPQSLFLTFPRFLRESSRTYTPTRFTNDKSPRVCAPALQALQLQGGQILKSIREMWQSYKQRLPRFTPGRDGIHLRAAGPCLVPRSPGSRCACRELHTPPGHSPPGPRLLEGHAVPAPTAPPNMRVRHRAPNFRVCFCLKD